MQALSWDFIVIGAGSAGCALVHELSRARPDWKILLIEAGPADASPFIRLQAGAFQACIDHDWQFHSEPDPSRNGAHERWWKGRVLGGSSSVNSTIFVRGAPHDFDRWDQLCGRSNRSSWSWDAVRPLFEEMECSDQEGATRGKRGLLAVRTVRNPHTVATAFVDAAVAAGHRYNSDYNGPEQEGVAYAQLTQRNGWRCSAADAFLKPALKTSKVELLLGAEVQDIEMEGARAVAVRFRCRGRVRRETAAQVVVCAGAINSPKLLMLSGIGDSQDLKSVGINARVHLPGVGRNLIEHPLVRMSYRSRIPTYNLTGGVRQKLSFAAKYLAHREGPITNVFEALAFVKTTPEEITPDVQLHFVSLGYTAMPDSTLALARYPAFQVYINKSTPLSSGRVRLRSKDPSQPPLIECNLLENEADLRTLSNGIRLVRRIMDREPIKSLVIDETEPGRDLNDETALGEFVRANTTSANHTAGTCRMGLDDMAVVDPELRVRGTTNLWVADASIMPDLISGNTNATCMMIGKKLGRELAGRPQY